jgi:hypothetical protein
LDGRLQRLGRRLRGEQHRHGLVFSLAIPHVSRHRYLVALGSEVVEEGRETRLALADHEPMYVGLDALAIVAVKV